MSKSETLGVRLNNPGNIRYAKRNRFIGLLGQENGFCKFESLTLGVRACCVVIRNYMRRGVCTISDIISRYAPASDGNNVAAYVDYMCNRLNSSPCCDNVSNYTPDTRLYWTSTAFIYFIQALCWYESRCELSYEEVMQAYRIMDVYI